MAFVLALVFFKGEAHRRLRTLLAPILASYAIALTILSPYLYFFFLGHRPHGPLWPTFLTSADLLFFLLPSHISELARIPTLGRFLHRFPLNSNQEFSYLGPVLLLVVIAFARRHWREPRGALLLSSAVLIALAAMGPNLIVGGREVMRPPGEVLAAMPLIGAALPVRFTLYLMFVAALITALWLANSSARMATKCAVVALAVIFAMPSLLKARWNSPDDTPAFFTADLYRQYLSPGEVALVAPFGGIGNSMLWQAQTHFYFRMPGGYTGVPPRQFQQWPALIALFNGNYLPDPRLQLKAFLAAHRVTAVLVDSRAPSSTNPKQRRDWRIVRAALGAALRQRLAEC